MQLRQGFMMETATTSTPFELQYLEYVAEFSETLFPSCLQSNCHVNCMLDGSWVHCTEVLKVMWSGELSDKCITVSFYVYNNMRILHINVRLNQTIRLMIFQNIQH